jgi:hypothetical protein
LLCIERAKCPRPAASRRRGSSKRPRLAFIVWDHNEQALAFVYCEDEPGERRQQTPPPWTVEETAPCFIVWDPGQKGTGADGQLGRVRLSVYIRVPLDQSFLESLDDFHGLIWPRSLDRPLAFVVHYYAEKGLCRTHTPGPSLDGQRAHAFVS